MHYQLLLFVCLFYYYLFFVRFHLFSVPETIPVESYQQITEFSFHDIPFKLEGSLNLSMNFSVFNSLPVNIGLETQFPHKFY